MGLGYKFYQHEVQPASLPLQHNNTTAMVRQFHDGMQARVQNDVEFSEPFEVTNGVKQGCVMPPTLFSMMFSAMIMGAF